MPKYTFYVDIWLLQLGCNFIFEYLLLWATATVTRTRTKPRRIVLASALGTFHYLLYLLASLNLIPFYGLLRFLPVIILVSLAMLAITFYPFSRSKLLTLLTHFYGIGFAAAGAGMASAYLFGGSTTPLFPLGTVIAIFTILLIAELGWGIVHERVINRVYQIPLYIFCDGQSIQATALVDTGNNLKDPVNKQPVIIVEHKILAPILPPELNTIIRELEDNHSAIDELANITEWQTRLRLIPFSSIGRKNGLLIGFRPDEIRIDNQPLTHLHPTIAIHYGSLDPHGEYFALVPPAVMEQSAISSEFGERGEAHAETTPADF